MQIRTTIIAAFITTILSAADSRPPAAIVDAIGFTVSDLDRSIDFYSKVLSFERVSEVELSGPEYEHLEGVFGLRMRTARLRLGDEFIELTEYLAPSGRSAPNDAQSNDVSFQHVAIIVSDMEEAYRRLRQWKVRHASTGPQRLPEWNRNAAGIQAFYFRDPDGHPLEVLAFPTGKGNEKWHSAGGRLFLGIDHTAIVITNTQASLRFYRDVLGLQVTGESENFGTEQEHLNNVFGARLKITTLRGTTGPGVELLEYLAPQSGRPYPRDERPNDVVHSETSFLGPDVDETAAFLRKIRSVFVSTGTIEAPSAETGSRKTVIVRDPDGHAVRISERSKTTNSGEEK
jgi:catechol 2,3-dioxygenase-like lactoylglutathione lyase family enzyme